MSRVIDAVIAYRVLKLLVTPFNKTKAFELGIIDDKGKVLKKSKDFSAGKLFLIKVIYYCRVLTRSL